jgi:hypothetical protein
MRKEFRSENLNRRSHSKTRRRRDNIRMDLRNTGWEGVEWIHLAQNREQWWVLKTVMNLRVPSGNFLTI